MLILLTVLVSNYFFYFIGISNPSIDHITIASNLKPDWRYCDNDTETEELRVFPPAESPFLAHSYFKHNYKHGFSFLSSPSQL